MLDRHRFFESDSFETCEHIYGVSGLKLEPHATAELRDDFWASANRFTASNFELYYYSFSAGQTLTAPPDAPDYWLTLPSYKNASGQSVLASQITKLSSPTRNDPVDIFSNQGMIGLRLDGTALQEFARNFLGDDFMGRILFEPKLMRSNAIETAISAQLMAAVDRDFRDPETFSDPLWQEQFFSAIVSNLLTLWPNSQARYLNRPASGPSPRDVKRVVDFIEANLDKPLSLSMLADVGGVPIRTLSEHFARFVGASPFNYVRRRRLLSVRAALSSGNHSSVSEVLLRYGISSPGRFSGEYMALFGEYPWQTLKRAK